MIVLENFLPKDTYESIKEELYSNTFPWYYCKSSNTDIDTYDQLSHWFFVKDNPDNFVSHNFDLIRPIVEQLNPYELLRVKANIVAPMLNEDQPPYHVDVEIKNAKVGILYFCTNDGKTIFKNGESSDTVDNRFISFSATESHTVKRHTSGKMRVVLNINWI